MENSLLARLPPELRNDIYERVIYSEDITRLQIRPLWPGEEKLKATQALEKYLLALTKTCRSIRAEILPLFYSSNIFVLERSTAPLGGNAELKVLDTFRQAIGLSSARALRNVCLDLGQIWVDGPRCSLWRRASLFGDAVAQLQRLGVVSPECEMRLEGRFAYYRPAYVHSLRFRFRFEPNKFEEFCDSVIGEIRMMPGKTGDAFSREEADKIVLEVAARKMGCY